MKINRKTLTDAEFIGELWEEHRHPLSVYNAIREHDCEQVIFYHMVVTALVYHGHLTRDVLHFSQGFENRLARWDYER